MSVPRCSRTEILLAALRRDALAEAERDHLATCAACADAVAAEAAFAALAATLSRQARLPSAHVVQLRARLEARRRLAERSLRPLALWRSLAATLAVAGLAVGLAFAGPLVGSLTAASAPPSDPGRLLVACVLVGLYALPFATRARAPLA